MADIIISKDKKAIDMKKLAKYISRQSYWGKNRSREKIKRSVENSVCYSVLLDNEFAGFARVVTDFSTFKYLCDVFILPEYQGKGLGKKLMEYIMDDPEIKDGGCLLLTSDAHDFYRKFGFLNSNKELTDKLMYKMDNKREEL